MIIYEEKDCLEKPRVAEVFVRFPEKGNYIEFSWELSRKLKVYSRKFISSAWWNFTFSVSECKTKAFLVEKLFTFAVCEHSREDEINYLSTFESYLNANALIECSFSRNTIENKTFSTLLRSRHGRNGMNVNLQSPCIHLHAHSPAVSSKYSKPYVYSKALVWGNLHATSWKAIRDEFVEIFPRSKL